jgi:hypothetical protein
MMKKRRVVLSALCIVCLVLGVVGSAQAGMVELIVGDFNSSFNSYNNTIYLRVEIHGTGDIAGGAGYLTVANQFLNAVVEDVSPSVQAFINLATSRGCTVGNVIDRTMDPGDNLELGVSFTCGGRRGKLISVLGEMMKFPLEYDLTR